MPSSRKGVAAAPLPPAPGRGAESAAAGQSAGVGGGRRDARGVQEWPDRSKYEGGFADGVKHGTGRFTWSNGEYYEGSFYKDCRHGDGVYCWPTGHKFIGKFYLNRKEGYGKQVFPDGTTFQGLYHADQRFGPGVLSYPDGCQDVGLWLGHRLLRLCIPVEDSFSLKNVPEYATFMDSAVSAGSRGQPPAVSSDLQTKAWTDFRVDLDLTDESFVLPSGIESYSTDGDHLPLPPGRRRELDRLFYGELWDPGTQPYRGYQRDPLSTLPLQARMQAHIHNHRALAEKVDWNVAAVLALNRGGFGPGGPLETGSKLLIQQAGRGDVQALSQILQKGFVHPDVADSRGNTALFAATVHCHNSVIHLLLDMGVDVDRLNCEGMSPLAICHVLYYPFKSLHIPFARPDGTRVSDRPRTRVDGRRTGSPDAKRDASYPSYQRRDCFCTLKLLLDRGADANVSRVPVPVIFLAVMAADSEQVKRLLLCGARTDLPLSAQMGGLHPVHVAALLPGPAAPSVIELLLHAVTDPDAQACDQDEVYEHDRHLGPLSTGEDPHPAEGGRTALHMACQRESDHENASKVVALLLSNGARSDLLWSGHSPLSLAISSGNDLATEELLKGGADPNLPLGARVGSALCVAINFNYHLVRDRIKQVDMLVKAGADVLMQVRVGDVVGTAIDVAHYSFNQDARIANTPYHALTLRERELFIERSHVLSVMGDLQGKTAMERERQRLETQLSLSSPASSCAAEPEGHWPPSFKFCYSCGRSYGVRLTACTRCRKVFYCSNTCKLRAWERKHRDECVRVPAALLSSGLYTVDSIFGQEENYSHN